MMQNIQKINYDNQFLQIKSSLTNKPKLLLHVCCAPCATYCLTQLIDSFDVTLYYANDNITDTTEWQKRLDELKKLTKIVNDGRFAVIPSVEMKLRWKQLESERFFTIAKGLETLPEGDLRCKECFVLRLSDACEYAKKHGFDYFATTLTVSPYKNSRLLNEIGTSLQTDNLRWLPTDFKKRDGYNKSIELCKLYDIYRQHYCGCCFSLAQQLANIKPQT